MCIFYYSHYTLRVYIERQQTSVHEKYEEKNLKCFDSNDFTFIYAKYFIKLEMLQVITNVANGLRENFTSHFGRKQIKQLKPMYQYNVVII